MTTKRAAHAHPQKRAEPMLVPPWRIVELASRDRFAIQRHFLELGAEDRRLRFGIALRDERIGCYVEGIHFATDTLLGAIDRDRRLVGVAHLARTGRDAELGLSVLPDMRSRGVGSALFHDAAARARAMSVRRLYMHCLAENATVLRLAVRNAMRVCRAAGEADAWLELDPAPLPQPARGERLCAR